MKKYRIRKYNTNEHEKCYDLGGGYTEEDVKLIIKGYKFNGFFYEKKNSNIIYVIEEEDEIYEL